MSAGPLENLQRFVTGAVMSPSSLGEDAVAIAKRLIVPSGRGMTAPERLEVYREQFWSRHLSNLRDDFPTLIWVVGGAARFCNLATEYLRAYPPATWDLQRLGHGLPAFVANETPWRDDDLARDAARLDWAFMEASDAPDAPPLDPHLLAAIPEDVWPHATVVFHPSLRALVFEYPIHQVREALVRGDDIKRPGARGSQVVVWRDAACVLRAASIEQTAWQVLAALAAGAPLGEACEAVARGASAVEMAELGPRVGHWFQQWSANGWVSAVLPPAPVTGQSGLGRGAGGS